jgi:hypothetical protein
MHLIPIRCSSLSVLTLMQLELSSIISSKFSNAVSLQSVNFSPHMQPIKSAHNVNVKSETILILATEVVVNFSSPPIVMHLSPGCYLPVSARYRHGCLQRIKLTHLLICCPFYNLLALLLLQCKCSTLFL